MQHNVPNIPPQSIYLSSRNGTPLNEYGNYMEFTLRNKLVIPSHIQAFCSLASMSYSNVFYNISSVRKNNVLYYRIAGIDYEHVLADGNYNVTNLLERLNTALEPALSFSYDDFQFRITVVGYSAFSILDGSNSVNRILGFVPFSSSVFTYTGQYALNLTGVRRVIVSVPNMFLDSNGVPGTELHVLDSINNNVLLGSSVSYSNTSSNKYQIFETALSSIVVRLSDSDGNNLDFLGSEWVLTMHITYTYTPLLISEPNYFPTSYRLAAEQQPTQNTTTI